MNDGNKKYGKNGKKRVGIIGGAGFIGGVLLCRMDRETYDPVVIDLPEMLGGENDISSIPASIENFTEISSAVKNCYSICNLAAVHRDDVSPVSRYYDVNVKGSENVCRAAEANGIESIVFTSSVAVYGFTGEETDEEGDRKPFNHYGKSKLQAEEVYKRWQAEEPERRTLVIVRPTVVFGEGNRGNVYNLLKQIASGMFIMVGKGNNRKSMAYVENVAAFLEYVLSFGPGYYEYNYVDKPDFDMNSLVELVSETLNENGRKKSPVSFRLPYWVGYTGGAFFDLLSKITGKKYPVSAIRVKKFCSNTLFGSRYIPKTGFTPPYSLKEGLKNMIQSEFL